MTDYEEILDLVDENDNVIGQMSRTEVYAKGLTNNRVINAFIINSKGQLWIPRRTADKRIFPSALDVSVGGHVESGESYDQAFIRETAEELNLDVGAITFREIKNLNPSHGVQCFMKVYEIPSDKTPDYNKDDFVDSYWLYPQEVVDRVAAGDRAKSDLVTLCKLIYGAV